MTDHGIQHQKTYAHTPWQNGVAERMNRTLKELVRAMIHPKAIGIEMWAEAITTAAYIRIVSQAVDSLQTLHPTKFGMAVNRMHTERKAQQPRQARV